MKKFTMLVLLFVAITGCQDDDGTVVDTEPVEVDFENVEMGAVSGEALVEANFVINTPTEWEDFKAYVNSAYDGSTPYVALDGIAVDYEAYTVIAVVGPFWQNFGNTVEISSIVANNVNLTVTGSISYPEDEYVMPAHSQPYHIVKIPKTTLPVLFDIQ